MSSYGTDFNKIYRVWYHSLIITLVKELIYCPFKKKDIIYLFLERREGREKKRERNISVWLPLMCPLLGMWPATQACALTGNRTSNPLVHRLALSPLSHTSQG